MPDKTLRQILDEERSAGGRGPSGAGTPGESTSGGSTRGNLGGGSHEPSPEDYFWAHRGELTDATMRRVRQLANEYYARYAVTAEEAWSEVLGSSRQLEMAAQNVLDHQGLGAAPPAAASILCLPLEAAGVELRSPNPDPLPTIEGRHLPPGFFDLPVPTWGHIPLPAQSMAPAATTPRPRARTLPVAGLPHGPQVPQEEDSDDETVITTYTMGNMSLSGNSPTQQTPDRSTPGSSRQSPHPNICTNCIRWRAYVRRFCNQATAERCDFCVSRGFTDCHLPWSGPRNKRGEGRKGGPGSGGSGGTALPSLVA